MTMTKVVTVCFMLCLLGSSLAVVHDNATDVEQHIRTAFVRWRAKYNKTYSSIEQAEAKLRVFRDNYYHVKAILDTQPSTFTVGLTKFADITNAEFRSMLSGAPKNRPFLSKRSAHLPTENLPDRVDWREHGAVTPVVNQGQCGSSPYFSAIGSLECLYKQIYGDLVPLSIQQVIDCSKDWGNMGCNGGFMDYAFQYVADKGIESAHDYQYTAKEGQCKYDKSKVILKITNFFDVPSNNQVQLAAAVAQGAVATAVAGGSRVWQFYTGGIIDSPDCGSQVDHGILLIGYDNTGSTPYWILKDSWGTDFGEHGYVRVAKSDQRGPGVCGIAVEASYPSKSNH